MIERLTGMFTMPPIEQVFFPPLHKGGQPRDAEFMGLSLEGGAGGLSYVLVPESGAACYAALQPTDFVGKSPHECALEFGTTDPVRQMISLAAINAICQQVMLTTCFEVDSTTDSVGLLAISKGDRVGMVGLFMPLLKTIQKEKAELVIVEKKGSLIEKFPHLPITLEPSELRTCNKILCTSTTILNNSLDDILAHCSPDALISVVGPTAGYFPDPLFARGVDVVGGRMVTDGAVLIKRLEQKERWGDITRKVCFNKKTYAGMVLG